MYYYGFITDRIDDCNASNLISNDYNIIIVVGFKIYTTSDFISEVVYYSFFILRL